ncbi:cytochrome P450 [Roridomyces roridus]|uniref:Cytochrome P450 n=1 Tax=Roridomyces roridus TaxID=1738132 RepID=A0AAD7CK60_9AGAR|nr:cytochrome P450 [Roridomyces roridus]
MLPHVLVPVIFAGLTSHWMFNKLEPRALLHFILLLALPPTLLVPLVIRHMSNVLHAILFTYCLYLLSLMTSVATYRLSPFHPLAQYPGPVLCKLTKLYLAGISMGGKQHLYYSELHRRFGDVVRIGPNELSFRDVNAIIPMMGSKGMPKGPCTRRAWNRAFSTSALKDYEVVVDNRVSQFVDILGTKLGAPVDISQRLGWLTFDIMNDVMFSAGGDTMKYEDREDTSRLLRNAQPMALLMAHLPWFSEIYLWLPCIGQGLRSFRKYASERVSERKARGCNQMDVFYHLIDEGGLEPHAPSHAQILSDGGLAIIAGSETTSTTLSHIIWFLICHPKAYLRLQAEIDDPKNNSGVPASQARMPYLNAVINEALRIFPAVLSGSQRAPRIDSGGQSIGYHFVPEGTSTVVHTYSLHHDPRYFSPLPDAFIPERWLSSEEQLALEPELFGDKKNVFRHNTAAFIPFSIGPSNCVGRNLAYQEMRMVICSLMSKFDMRFEKGFDVGSWEESILDYFVVQRGRLPVILTARNT